MKYKKFYQKIKSAFLMPQSEAPSRIHSGRKALAVSLLVLFVSLAGIGALFSLTFRWDNKYTYTGNSLHVLAEGWEFYPDLSLEEHWNDNDGVFSDPEVITIGQYGNFKSFHHDTSPFGTAVYRKQLYLEPAAEGWLLELPEIYSASNRQAYILCVPLLFYTGLCSRFLYRMIPQADRYPVRSLWVFMPLFLSTHLLSSHTLAGY